jgi:hypothetical protein
MKNFGKKSFLFILSFLLVLSPIELILASSPTVLTGIYDSIGASTSNLYGSISDDGGETNTERGFEYGTTISYGSTSSSSGSFNDDNYSYSLKIGTLGSGNDQFHTPYGVTVDSSGNIYVADNVNHRIQKFDSSGVYVSQFGSSGTGNGEFNTPRGVMLDSSDNIHVADSLNHRIQKFDSSGVYVSQFGSLGTDNGEFNTPREIFIDTNRDLYVVDFGNSRIQKFSNGGFSSSLTGLLCNTTYHYRAYSTNASGTAYGSDATFTTDACTAPTTSTTSSSSITTTTATLTGNITDTGGEANTIRGFDIGTDNTYTMTDITESGSYSTGSYSLTVTGLTCNTTYHYRAYSTNTAGTGTGSDDTFTTSSCPVTVTASTGGAVPVWILEAMNNPQTINQNPVPAPVLPPVPNPTPQPTPQPKFQFTKNLKYRDRSTDVLELQKFLNTNGYILSNTGAGSIGSETTYFGPATRNALIKFQKDNNIKPAVGYFGVVTRGVVNNLLK